MLIGLAAKNAILIVEFAKAEYEKGKPLLEAALEGARLRLRPILMTSFAFIFGCCRSGPPAVRARSRANSGTTVIGGMLAASAIAIFLIPVTFYVIERFFAGHESKESEMTSKHEHNHVAAQFAPPVHIRVGGGRLIVTQIGMWFSRLAAHPLSRAKSFSFRI